MKKLWEFYFLILIIIVYINMICASYYPYTRVGVREINSGVKCENASYYSVPKKACVPCSCDKIGSMSIACDGRIGQCRCKTGYNGQKCTSCSAGYYRDIFKKTCIACNCSKDGSKSIECNRIGQCQCKRNIVGKKCNRCLNLNLNFRKECTENCPEMYLPIAENFEKFDRKLNEIQSFLNRVGMEKNKMDELTAKINGLNEEIVEKTDWADGDLLKLKDVVNQLQNQIKFYVKNAENLNRLQRLTKKILRELYKINNAIMGARDICADACNTADLYEKERKNFLNKLSKIIADFNKASLRISSLENEAKIWKNQAEINAGKTNKTLEKLKDLQLPNEVLNEGLLEVEHKRLQRILQEITEMKEDAEKIGELYEETKRLQEDSAALTVKVLDAYLERYKTGVKNKIESIIKSLLNYEDELKNISSLIQSSLDGNISTLQYQLETNLDKLQEFKIQAEKIIADDNLTKETLIDIFNILEKIQLTVSTNTKALEETRENYRKEEAILDEKNAEIETKTKNAITQMEEETEALENDLVEIEEDLAKTEKEVESLADVLDKMETLILLSKEVANLKAIKEELDKIPENTTCTNVNLV